jgi:BON domain
MTNKSILKMAFMAFSLMLAFNLGTFAQKVDCSKTTDSEIVDAIYTKMKIKHEAQMSQVNVRIKDGVVTLEGWATTKGVKKDIEKMAKKASCVKKVMNNLTIGVGGGCGPGTKPCGDICIPTSEPCNIRVKGD